MNKIKKILGHKKAQFYIFTAIILIAAIVVLTINTKAIFPTHQNENFESLYENYKIESQKTLNYAIINGKDIEQTFTQFIHDFEKYAEEKNTNFNHITIISIDDKTLIFNHLGQTVNITNTKNSDTTQIKTNTTQTIERTNEINVGTSTNNYEIETKTKNDLPTLKAIIIETTEQGKIVKLI